MDGSDALKPLVLKHAERWDIGRIWCIQTISFYACWVSMHVENRLPKNQWLIHRRICSLPDGCNLLIISYHFLHPSANETNRLLINHWFFCRRIFSVSSVSLGNIALKPLVLRIDSPVRLKNTTSTIGSFADGVSHASCETQRDALKPLVGRQTPVVRHNGMP